MTDAIQLTDEQAASLVIAVCGPNGDHPEGEMVISEKLFERLTPKQSKFTRIVMLRALMALMKQDIARDVSAQQREGEA